MCGEMVIGIWEGVSHCVLSLSSLSQLDPRFFLSWCRSNFFFDEVVVLCLVHWQRLSATFG